MRFSVIVALVEVGLLGSVIAVSQLRARDEVAPKITTTPTIDRHDRRVTQRQFDGDFLLAFQAARSGLELHLSAADKAVGLAPHLLDAILRMEGMYDPTRVRVFGSALRMQIRPGTASMTDVFGDRWTRVSVDPNLHRRVRYIAEGWLRPRAGGCDDFWMFRRNESPVMIDRLAPHECRQLRSSDDAAAPVVAARLSLPAFAAPYPGNRLSSAELRAEQAAHIQATLQKQWFRRQILSPLFGVADAGRSRHAPFGRKAAITAGSVSSRAAPIRSRQ